MRTLAVTVVGTVRESRGETEGGASRMRLRWTHWATGFPEKPDCHWKREGCGESAECLPDQDPELCSAVSRQDRDVMVSLMESLPF